MNELPTEFGKQAQQQELLACAQKMLENVELQIQVTYDYERLKELYAHKEVIKAMVDKYQEIPKKQKPYSGCKDHL
ncbi:MAG: hypothetical protein AAFO69_04350 [Bacteroidota bacterium]